MRGKRIGAVILAFLLICSILTVPVVGQQWARGEPDISVHVPDNEVVLGSDNQVNIELLNDGEVNAGMNREAVTTARAVSVEMRDSGPFDVRSGSTAVGTIPDGSVATATQRLVVPSDIEPGEYEITLRVRYSYTSQYFPGSGIQSDRSARQDIDVSITVVSEPRFAITSVATDVQPGTSGEAELTIENIGSEPAYEVRGAVTGLGGVTIGGETAEPYLGTLEPGSDRNITVDTAIAETVKSNASSIEASFTYRDGEGIKREAGPIVGSLSPMDRQSVSIEAFEGTVSVGYDGEIRGTLRNDGPRTISDGVLVVEPMSDSLVIEERRYALPELGPNKTTEFRFPTDVGGQADPGPRQVRFTVEYSNDGRQVTEVGPVSQRVVVDPRQSAFAIADVGATVSAGGVTQLRLEITNQRPETLSNINAKLYTESPLSSTSEESFVNELAPGESAEVVFTLSAAGDATPKTYPVELDFQYDTARGETVLSQTYQHPVDVTEPEEDDGGIPFAGIAFVVLILGGAVTGIWWYRRR